MSDREPDRAGSDARRRGTLPAVERVRRLTARLASPHARLDRALAGADAVPAALEPQFRVLAVAPFGGVLSIPAPPPAGEPDSPQRRPRREMPAAAQPSPRADRSRPAVGADARSSTAAGGRGSRESSSAPLSPRPVLPVASPGNDAARRIAAKAGGAPAATGERRNLLASLAPSARAARRESELARALTPAVAVDHAARGASPPTGSGIRSEDSGTAVQLGELAAKALRAIRPAGERAGTGAGETGGPGNLAGNPPSADVRRAAASANDVGATGPSGRDPHVYPFGATLFGDPPSSHTATGAPSSVEPESAPARPASPGSADFSRGQADFPVVRHGLHTFVFDPMERRPQAAEADDELADRIGRVLRDEARRQGVDLT